MNLREIIIAGMSGPSPVIALNLFLGPDGKFQANVGRREPGAYKIAKHDDPAKAIELAFKAAGERPVLAFDGLLE